MGRVSIAVVGLGMTVGVIAAQALLPFAFDFLSSLALYAGGVWVGHKLGQ